MIVMTRVPRLGRGKTRLRRVLSDDARARLQEAFLRDTVEVALEADIGPVYLAYTPPEDAARIESQFGSCTIPVPQRGDSLGARMVAVLRYVAARRHTPLIMVGTDTPLLQPQHLRMALLAAQRDDVCLGPSADGGYYLVACRAVISRLFDGVPWGTDSVLQRTQRLAAEAGLRHSLLEPLYDIDTPEDLISLRRDLWRLSGDPSFRMPKHTFEALFSRAGSLREEVAI